MGAPNDLSPERVHLWQFYWPPHRLPQVHRHPWLSPEERDRAASFRYEADRQRYGLGRLGLRWLLSRHLGGHPATLEFAYGAYGKPQLAHPGSARDLQFNLAHSGDWIVYGVSRDRAIGVDVEKLAQRPHLDRLIGRCLSATEQASMPTADAARLRCFLALWTLKEAHLKAIGQGLYYPMNRVEIGLLPTPQLRCPAQVPELPAQPWLLKSWQPAPDYLAAVCVAGEPAAIAPYPFPAETVNFAQASPHSL